MAGVTVVDSSCLIGLSRIAMLDLLGDLYGDVVIPPAVELEFGQALPSWCATVAPEPSTLAQVSTSNIGAGETEAIALAIDHSAARIILDDQMARSVARAFHLTVTGTVGILLRAKSAGLLSEVKTAVDNLIANGFYLSDGLVDAVLKQAGE